MFRTRTARAAATALLISASAMLALAGCSANEPELQQNEAASMEQWQHDFDRCLKENGLDSANAGIPVNPDGSPIETNEDGTDVGAVLQNCADQVGPVPQSADSVTDEQLNEQLLAYAKCMREAGYDVPDPQPDANGFVVQQNGGPEADPSDIERCSQQAGLISQSE